MKTLRLPLFEAEPSAAGDGGLDSAGLLQTQSQVGEAELGNPVGTRVSRTMIIEDDF